MILEFKEVEPVAIFLSFATRHQVVSWISPLTGSRLKTLILPRSPINMTSLPGSNPRHTTFLFLSHLFTGSPPQEPTLDVRYSITTSLALKSNVGKTEIVITLQEINLQMIVILL